jgi:hypothetical protein
MRALRSFTLEYQSCTAFRGAKKEERFIMNIYIKLIIKTIGCSEPRAMEIFDELCSMDIRLGSSSEAKIVRFIKEANINSGCR